MGTEEAKVERRMDRIALLAYITRSAGIRSVEDEALSRLILFDGGSHRHASQEYMDHYHHGGNHQGKGNVPPFPLSSSKEYG